MCGKVSDLTWILIDTLINVHVYFERLAFAHFLQLALISFAQFLRFHLRTIFTPQSGSISNQWS